MRRHLLLGCLLLAIPFLAGAKCAFFFSTGDSDPRPKDPNEPAVVAAQGQFVAIPIQGIGYESGALAGVTGEHGEFLYEEGASISFYLGDIPLGGAVAGRQFITPLDLVEAGSTDHLAVINMVRLLQSLDATPGDATINIPPSVRQEAVASNTSLFWAVQSLDFADRDGFDNAASAMVATLTRDYPFTAVLVDADTTKNDLIDAISNWKAPKPEAPVGTPGP